MNNNNKLPTILIVDDNPKNLQILGNYLQMEGFLIEFALNGNIALEWIEKLEFDLILLDINMPGMDGYETCKIIKNNPLKHDIPIIFLTAKTDAESIVNAFDLGAVDYITKPFNQKELIARVRTQIVIKNSREEISRNLIEIKSKNKQITDSIQYASLIQTAVLNESQNRAAFFQEHFILNLPKDIVSGDFYWFHKTDDKLLVCVFDCTGHGVPGAFMSMLGITLLNETVIRDKIYKPNLILNQLRKKIIDALGQKGDFLEVADGMDGSIISFDLKHGSLVYSGAFNPLYLVRNNKIIEFKADRMPLSHYAIMNDFSSHEIEILPNDLIYLSTDGYIDQSGGQNLKKFKSGQFKETLVRYHKHPLEIQKQMLQETFDNWKGNNDQVDDIIIVGLKL
ncbi:MAG: response regulator [Salinivirgaceae bacterium]|jgi:sigma-B regulation protein RsbU (phosphoserine phosphatase)|nr:response regulator [Salinivirgaceae bacterium]